MVEAFVAAFCVALISLVGALFFGARNHLAFSHRYVVPIAMGVFLGVVFFELIPETLEEGGFYGSLVVVVGFLSFYLLSHVLRTFHHHPEEHENSEHRATAVRLLVGDAIHNVADGAVIASAFLINPAAGIATTIGIAFHEIPQEIAEFGVLLRSGYTIRKAAFYNLLSATSILLGVLLAFVFLKFGDFLWILTGLAAGNLLYIAASDMIPELNSEKHRAHFMKTFVATVLGLVAIAFLLYSSHGQSEHEQETTHTEVALYA